MNNAPPDGKGTEIDQVEHVKPDFPEDAFAGTAPYYVRYQFPYPKALVDDLHERAAISGDGRLLDLACGPGRIAIRLAPLFRDVWVIDREPEMIAVGREEANQRGAVNIKWFLGKAEQLQAESGSFELVTIGEAFHRLDQRLITQKALQWLTAGRCLATIGCYSIIRGKESWQRIVAEIVRRWTNRNSEATKTSSPPKPGRGPGHNERVLKEAGFEDVESYSFEHPHVWTIESIIGNLYSTSRCSRKVLAHTVDGFEADMKHALLDHDPSGRYLENMRCGYTIARKPR